MALQSAARMPRLIYGTAWKKNSTAGLVAQALHAGFRGIDTAAQPKHYQEDLVGEGIRQALADGNVCREDLYLQTKYTSVYGQDVSNMPYKQNSSIPEQVRGSVASSLRNLRHSDSTDSAYLDCVVMHSPLPTIDATMQAWKTLEEFVPNRVRTLGISNVSFPILEALYSKSSVKPSVVQNRFYRATGYDADIRAFCATHSIIYQSFWTLTGNPQLLRAAPVLDLARAVAVDPAVALYGLVLGLDDIAILDGTTTQNHMRGDLEGLDAITTWQQEKRKIWTGLMKDFHVLLTL